MINNAHQRAVTQRQADQFAAAILEMERGLRHGATIGLLQLAELDGMRSVLADLQDELNEYDRQVDTK